MKKYLEDKITPNNKKDYEENHHEIRGTNTTDSKCKWVKTDSECKFHYSTIQIKCINESIFI